MDHTRILIVDDNVVYRKFISQVVASIEGAEVVNPAPNGRIALSKLVQTAVDLVLLDIQMPEMDGIETLVAIKKSFPLVGVVMMSAAYASDADMVVKALEIGALDFIPKSGMNEGENTVQALRQRVASLMHQVQGLKNLQKARLMTKERGKQGESVESNLKRQIQDENRDMRDTSGRQALKKPWPLKQPPTKIDVVVIGASTGGPNALGEVIPRLPRNLGVPILLVQHMPPFLTASFASSLNAKSKLVVREAVDGETLLPDTVYIAPGGHHMTVKRTNHRDNEGIRRLIRINMDPPENSVRPSADVLFRSVATAYNGNILAVMMTGMGTDGMKGVYELKIAGACYCLTQTEETCVVYGMPKAVDEAALSDEKIPLKKIADRITDLITGI